MPSLGRGLSLATDNDMCLLINDGESNRRSVNPSMLTVITWLIHDSDTKKHASH